ncbi:aldose epimerase family protein [Oceanirhabdus sp. W0125-5]|uniref:aldose epimerase family protein n=1 Tax=Oceanirhabdus sp. W0125-5 TaxID=2999116 RepID=UPI0022F3428E|nr:aldose epimerase family protein [Oceanirhabdus sp. W0125-5]WBW97280.1 galactose mutarotase [Oceanirhabdus sp. W0125-5]
MKLLTEYFGELKTGEEVIKFTLVNKNNIKISFLNYGGIIQEIIVPDRSGKYENIVLGFDNIRDYEEKSPYFGAIVGRIAGRISKAKFQIDGDEYILASNNGMNHIHGGIKGFDKVIWCVKEIKKTDYLGLEMSYISPDGEEGFPGKMNVKVTYILNNNNELEMKFSAVSDKKTIINMTNHSYFNLSGNLNDDILNHKLTINAAKVGFVDEETIPTGELVDVENSVFDFTKGKKIGLDIDKKAEQLIKCGGYDHPFVLDKRQAFSARVEDEKSGRIMDVITDQPVVVFYSGNQLGEDLILSENIRAKKRIGLCLETQDYPDSINQESFPKKIYNPGERYTACTKIKFYTDL